jgi:hypothetical protein
MAMSFMADILMYVLNKVHVRLNGHSRDVRPNGHPQALKKTTCAKTQRRFALA